MCLPVKIFSESKVIMAASIKHECKSCCGRLYCSHLCRVVFVIVHCLNMHDIAPQRTAVAEALNPHQQSFKKVVLKTIDAIHYFRVKNG